MLTQDEFKALLELDRAISCLYEVARIIGTGEDEAGGVIGVMFAATEIMRQHSRFRREAGDTFEVADRKEKEYRAFLLAEIPIEEKARMLHEEQPETI